MSCLDGLCLLSRGGNIAPHEGFQITLGDAQSKFMDQTNLKLYSCKPPSPRPSRAHHRQGDLGCGHHQSELRCSTPSSCYHLPWWFLSSCQGSILSKPILTRAGTTASNNLCNFLYAILCATALALRSWKRTILPKLFSTLCFQQLRRIIS